MKAFARALVYGGVLGATALVYACVGSDPVATTTGGDDGGTGNDGAVGPGTDSATGGDSASGDSGSGAACDGGIMCGGFCVDSTTDATNCGRCMHDCGKGKCSASVCQSVLVTGTVGGPPITSVTTDETDDNPKDIAAHVFWSSTGTGGGVFQDNVIGGNLITISTGASTVAKTNFVVSQGNVFWFAQNFGGAPQPIYKGQVGVGASQAALGTMNGNAIQSIMFDSAGKVVIGAYQISVSQFGSFRCPPGSSVTCAMTGSFTGAPGGNVATDGTNMYYGSPDQGFIARTTFDGSNEGDFILNQDTPTVMRVNGTLLYWVNSGTKTIKSGAVPSPALAKQVASTANAADGIAADGVNVYWVDSTLGSLNYAPISGAGPNTAYVTMATGAATSPMRLVRDTGFLYFSYNGAIYRVALP